MSHPQKKDILILAQQLERAEMISVASGDREPDARMSKLGVEWVVAGLRLLAEHEAALGYGW